MKKAFRSLLGSSLPYLFLFGTGLSARAQNPPGVTDKTIVIGSCSALEGPSHSLGAETVTGANAYFSLINEEGGVHGRKLKLVAYDDSYDPAKTEACFNSLLTEKDFALRFCVCTPTSVTYGPIS